MENNIDQIQQQICIIKVVFPISDDDEAIAIKKRIAESVKDIPQAQVNFNLIAGRPPMPGT